MFFDHNGIKLKINNKNIMEKSPNTWKLSNALLKNPWIKEVISRETEKF